MRTLLMMAGLGVLLAAAPASADLVLIRLIGPADPVRVGQDFEVGIEVTSAPPLAMVQTVFDNLNPALTLHGVDAPLASLAFVNPPDTAVMDFYPAVYPAAPGTFTAGTLVMSAALTGQIPLNLYVEDGSTFSTVVFDASYDANWTILTEGTLLDVECIPEPFALGMLALIGAGALLSARRKA